MSSILGDCSLPIDEEQPARRAAPPPVWPAGSRGVLTAAILAIALLLAWTSHSAPSPVGEALLGVPDLVLDPNTAPRQVLGALPHAGPNLVQQFVAARDERPFASLDDARQRVRGLGSATLGHLAPYLRFESATQLGPAGPVVHGDKQAVAKPRSTRRKKVRPDSPISLLPRLAARFSESNSLPIQRHD
jgi:hypothetical protein